MKVFGITGGVGAGKSEVLTYLGQNYDATVIQADEAGYLVMLPGGECYGEIVKLFGRQITTETLTGNGLLRSFFRTKKS